MLRKITLSAHLPLAKQSLIKAKSFRSAIHFTTVEQQARQQAQHILREARREAEALRAAAWLEGYSDGIRLASTAAVHYANNVEAVARQLLSEAQQQLESQLLALFAHEEATEALFKLIAHALGHHVDTNHKAIIVLPRHAAASAIAIREAFRQCGVTAELQTTPDDELRVEYGQQVWRCELPRQINSLAKMALEAAREELDIKTRLDDIRQQALRELTNAAAAGSTEA